MTRKPTPYCRVDDARDIHMRWYERPTDREWFLQIRVGSRHIWLPAEYVDVASNMLQSIKGERP